MLLMVAAERFFGQTVMPEKRRQNRDEAWRVVSVGKLDRLTSAHLETARKHINSINETSQR